MVDEVKKPVEDDSPADAPWKLNWSDKLKEATPEKGIVETVKDKVKPWLMEWGFISRENDKQSVKTPPVKDPSKPFDINQYLVKLAATESGNDPKAKAPTSSATGAHQFTSGTWMEMVNKMDLPYTLSDRTNPEKSAKVAKGFTEANVAKAKADLGREPTMLEAYMYHFVGKSAPRLIQAPYKDNAVDHVTPRQAKANKNVFYKPDGSPKTVGEVLNKYGDKFK
jgi:hypothetical protein